MSKYTTTGLLALLIMISCDRPNGESNSQYMEEETIVQHNAALGKIAVGEVIYVPIYSSIFYSGPKRTMDLAATLSIHNTDLEQPITLTKIWYHDSKGRLLRKYNTEKVQLKPLETRNFVIEEKDKSGGPGANFIVEWISEFEVTSPIIEAVMISTKYNVGISFISTGRVIKTIEKQR